MSLKELFSNIKVVSAEKTLEDLSNNGYSSAETAIAFMETKRKYLPDIDFMNPRNFCTFGLAEEYYKNSFKYIYSFFPYDGSRAEEINWFNSSSYLDRYIYENIYPKSVGMIDYTSISSSLSWYNFTNCTNFPYIPIYGGLNIDKIYNSGSNKDAVIKIDLEEGITFQYYLNISSLTYTGSGSAIISSSCHWGFATPPEYTATYSGMIIDLRDGKTLNLKYLNSTTPWTASINFGETPEYTSSLVTDYNSLSIGLKYNTSSLNFETSFYLNGYLIFATQSYCSNVTSTCYLTGVIGCLPLVSSIYSGSGTTYVAGAEPVWGSYGNYPAVNLKIDDFRVWGRKLQAKEIFTNYSNRVYGNFNDDSSYNRLLIYYKFNEGVTGSDLYDSVVLDYSGRKSNSTIFNYLSQIRSTSSAINLSSGSEFEDPILNINHPTLSSSIDFYARLGATYDLNNPHALLNHIPEWIVDEDYSSNQELLKLTQILSSQLDEIYILGKNIVNVKDTNYLSSGSYNEEIISRILNNYGLNTNGLFSDLTFDEWYLDKNDDVSFASSIQKTKVNLYKSLYNNLINIYKTKGTENSIRNTFRSLGFDEDLYRIKYYSNNGTYEIDGDKRKLSSVRKNYLDLSGNGDLQNLNAVVYQSYDGSTGSVSFISGSLGITTATVKELGHGLTMESTIVFPKTKNSLEDGYIDFPDSSLSGSLFGFYTPLTSSSLVATDSTVDQSLPYFNILFKRRDRESKYAKFILRCSSGSFVTDVESQEYSIFNDTKWTLALRFKPKYQEFPSLFSSSYDWTYNVELYGIEESAGFVVNEFTISQSLLLKPYFYSTFNSNVDSTVYALLLSGSNLYIGGAFNNVSGSTRNYIAVVDKDSGALGPFNPGCNDSVFSLLLSGSNLYIGGMFTNVSGTARNRLAVVDKDSGALGPFNPNASTASSTVFSLLLSGSNLYVGGSFTTISGTSRNRLAVVDKDSGALGPFNPDVGNGQIRTMLLSGSNLYLGGTFTLLSSTARAYVGVVDKNSGALSPFNPNPNGSVYSLLLSGSNLYVGGSFSSMSSSARGCLAVVNKDSGALGPFNPDVGNGQIRTLLLSGSNLYLGGSFTLLSSTSRNYIGVVDKDSGALGSFNLSAVGTYVRGMTISGSNLYIGGLFTQISGTSINNLSSVDKDSGALLQYAFFSDNDVYYISHPKKPYIGALRTNFTGTLVRPTQARFSYLRTWFTYLSNDEIKHHSYDPYNFGLLKPYENISNNDTSLSVNYIPRIKSLILNWDFQTITGSDSSGGLNVLDFSSGSSQAVNYSWFNNIFERRMCGVGYGFNSSNSTMIDRNYVMASKNRAIDNLLSSDLIRVGSNNDKYFGKTIKPISYILSVEKNIYDVVNDEILNYFSSISNFNELIGEPINLYRDSYKQLDKLRKIFFNKVINERIDINKYISYYKWLDTTLNYLIYDLIPISMRDSFKLGIVIESHLLERNKYVYPVTILKEKNRDFTFQLFGHFHPSVSWKPERIGEKIILSTWNDRIALPNKVFEF